MPCDSIPYLRPWSNLGMAEFAGFPGKARDASFAQPRPTVDHRTFRYRHLPKILTRTCFFWEVVAFAEEDVFLQAKSFNRL